MQERALRKQTLFKGIAVVCAAMMIQMGLGIVSIWGNIVVYVTSYMRSFPENEHLSQAFALSV